MVQLVHSSAPEYADGLVLPAQSNAAEQAVLGGLMLDNRAYDRIYDVLAESDFYRSEHRAIWREIGRLIDRNKQADPITIAEQLGQEQQGYLAELMMSVPSALHIRQHAQIVRDKAILRSLTAAGAEITALASETGADPQEAAEKAEARILSVLDRDAKDREQEPLTLKECVFQAVDWIEARRDDGIRTGYGQLDAMFPGGGMQPEQLIVIAGRPGMGKSTLSWCIAEHAAVAGKSVMYFAMETSGREIGLRALRWHESMTDRTAATKHLSELPILIDPSPSITLSHLRIRLRRMRRQRGLDLVVVDYVQLMRQRAENRLQEVSEVSRGLKAVAKEFGIPLIAVCQINRAAEGRTDRRPIMSDLRESGQLEQDADAIIMLYRDDVYSSQSHLAGYGEALVRKMRDGPTGEVLLKWDGNRTRWIDHNGPWPSEPKEDRADKPQRKRTVKQDWSGRE